MDVPFVPWKTPQTNTKEDQNMANRGNPDERRAFAAKMGVQADLSPSRVISDTMLMGLFKKRNSWKTAFLSHVNAERSGKISQEPERAQAPGGWNQSGIRVELGWDQRVESQGGIRLESGCSQSLESVWNQKVESG